MSSLPRPRPVHSLTRVQGDAVLDVVCQSRVVTQAWDQLQAAEETGEGETEQEVARYDQALERLVELFAAAHGLDVSDTVLVGVLSRNLPADVFNRITPETAA